jgi:hypothetical protein
LEEAVEESGWLEKFKRINRYHEFNVAFHYDKIYPPDNPPDMPNLHEFYGFRPGAYLSNDFYSRFSNPDLLADDLSSAVPFDFNKPPLNPNYSFFVTPPPIILL